jgi:hypothetical protein
VRWVRIRRRTHEEKKELKKKENHSILHRSKWRKVEHKKRIAASIRQHKISDHQFWLMALL